MKSVATRRKVPSAPFLNLLAFIVLLFAFQRGEAQQVTTSVPTCTPPDMFATPRFSTGSDGYFTVAYDLRNVADHDCNLDPPQYAPSFVPDRIQGHPPIGYKLSTPRYVPLLLRSGEIEHLTYRWRTTADPDAVQSCVQLKWIGGLILIVAPTLLKQVCSDVEGGLYEPGPFHVEPDQPASLLLSAPKPSFSLGEQFFLTLSGPRQSEEQAVPCPILFRLQRSPDGFTRFDQVTGEGFAGCPTFWLPKVRKGDWNTGFPVASGANSHWEGAGEHQFQLFEQSSTSDAAVPAFRQTQILALQITDPANLKRAWGVHIKGVAADVSLDKDTYGFDEDVPLHLAVENFDVHGPVSAWDPLWDPCRAISIRVLDMLGNPLADSARRGGGFCSGHGFGPNKEFHEGKIYPIERSLRSEGWLPKEPGDFTIVVTWAPLIGPNKECTPVEARASFRILPAIDLQ